MNEKHIKMSIEYENLDNFFKVLDDMNYETDSLLYRAFIREEDGLEKEIARILEKGTDRNFNAYLGDHEDGIHNLDDIDDYMLDPEADPLGPSDYLWLASKEELSDQIQDIDTLEGKLFVSVYNPDLVTHFTSVSDYAYKFLDPENKQDALLFLVEQE